MADVNKIIKALDCCLTLDANCDECPYNISDDTDELLCERNLRHDTVKLLKEKRKTGHWIPAGFYGYCSECGFHFGSIYAPNYCPKCGAKMTKMRGEEDD